MKAFKNILQLKKMEESHQEATEKEVERILACLQKYFADDRKHIVQQTVSINYAPSHMFNYNNAHINRL